VIGYFAYGSNLATSVMTERIPSACRPAAARLDGYRLWFPLPSRRWGGHAAGIEVSPGSAVWGVVWRMAERELPILDRYEANYHRIDVRPVADGEPIGAVSYVVRPDRRTDQGRPVSAYLAHMVQGAREHRLPAEWIDSLARIGTADPVLPG
jgi:gamma-glutamylcyclotransferase (GGCT)/AIG2-like uncharacterized protein YtfP